MEKNFPHQMSSATLSFAVAGDTEEATAGSHQRFLLQAVLQEAQARILGGTRFPQHLICTSGEGARVPDELLCAAGAAEGGDDALLPSKGSGSIPAREKAGEADERQTERETKWK